MVCRSKILCVEAYYFCSWVTGRMHIFPWYCELKMFLTYWGTKINHLGSWVHSLSRWAIMPVCWEDSGEMGAGLPVVRGWWRVRQPDIQSGEAEGETAWDHPWEQLMILRERPYVMSVAHCHCNANFRSTRKSSSVLKELLTYVQVYASHIAKGGESIFHNHIRESHPTRIFIPVQSQQGCRQYLLF